ncbi:MAG: hypothetical protein JSS97_18695 [Actinobacteria bacterium]|nr:hypothetical protein [Actinomycetota bacterium]
MAEVTERKQKRGQGGPERSVLALQNRQEPTPSAFDIALAERDVLKAVKPFIA